MATVVSRLEAILTANTRDFDRGMAASETKMHKVGKTAGVAGLAIAGGLAVGLDKSVKAAMGAQVSQARLEVAFKTAHLSASVYEKRIQGLEASSRKLGFTEEDVHKSLGSLIIATHSMKDASKDLSVAQDIARFKHIDLEAATKMLTMAQAGSQRATKQLGLTVQASTVQQDKAKVAYKAAKDALDIQQGSLKTGTAAQKEHYTALRNSIDLTYKGNEAVAKLADKHVTAAKVIALVTEKMHGQADAYSKTAAGSMEQFKAQLNFLEISLGTALIPILTKAAATLANLTAFFSEHTRVTKILIIALAALGATLVTVSVATKVAAAATKIYTAAQWLLNAALTANPIGIVIVALVALGVALVVAYNKVAFFRNGVNAAWDWIKDHWPLLAGIMGGPIGLAVAEIIKHRDRLVTIFTNLPGQLAAAFLSGVQDVKNAVTGLFGHVIHWAEHALGINSPSTVFHGIGQNVVRGFINGVGSMAGVLKNAVVGIATGALSHLNPFGGGTQLAPGQRQQGGTAGEQGGFHASATQAQQFASMALGKFGWGHDQFASLLQLWNGESGWRWNAKNSSSGAYGIPQSLPASKMGSAGPNWKDNAFTQIMWGLNYIKGRYGSPSSAYSAWSSRSPHWYAGGGLVPGSGLRDSVPAMLTPGEMILNRSQQNLLGGPGALARTFGFGPPRSGAFAGGGVAGGGTIIVPLNIDGNELARVMIDPIRRKAQVFSRRNGRRAF